MTGPPSLLASLLLATAAPAFTRPECPHGFVHDMGYGIVARRSVDVDELGEITAAAGLITDCVSGRTLAVKLNLPDLGGGEFDTHEIARGPGIQRGGQPQDLRASLGRVVSEIAFDHSKPTDIQTCGCARFYPELRGDRHPWRGWPLD